MIDFFYLKKLECTTTGFPLLAPIYFFIFFSDEQEDEDAIVNRISYV